MLALAVFLLTSPFLLSTQPPAACPDEASCRQAALEAAARQDFETFHDLAWRAAQKGRPNDPALMYLLARAQSLSGRPGDALVMLRRIAELGVPTDAADNDDFRRVRALPGWAELEARIAAVGETGEPPAAEAPAARPAAAEAPAARPAAAAPPPAPSAPESRRSAKAAAPVLPSSPPAVPMPPAAAAPAPAPAAPDAAAARTSTEMAAGGEEAVALNGGLVEPIGLAYDGASRRFVVGDRRANKLIVADDVFKRVNDLIGAASGGFGTLTAIAIDSHRGDLWAASTNGNGTASVHKLQLVSGRVLFTIPLPDATGAARLTDMMMTDAGTLLLLDADGARLLTLRTGAKGFGRAVRIEVASPASIAPAGALTYVAHQGGLARVDGQTGRVAPVQAAAGVDLTGLQRIRWTPGGLVAIRTDAEGAGRLVRIRLAGRGVRATSVEPLDPSMAAEGPALTIFQDAAYYIVRTGSGAVIRRVPLK